MINLGIYPPFPPGMGLERTIKANTEKRRTYSLFNQGVIYYGLLPGMKVEGSRGHDR